MITPPVLLKVPPESNSQPKRLPCEQATQQRLITRIVQGETEAFASIVGQYRSLMFHYAYLILRNPQSAEDAVQEAFLQAWQHLPGLRDVAALRRWLLRIVLNQALSMQRQFKRRDASLQQFCLEQESTFQAQEANEAKGQLERDWDLRQAIEQLPTKQREAILLHYYYGMSLPAMAQALRISQNTW